LRNYFTRKKVISAITRRPTGKMVCRNDVFLLKRPGYGVHPPCAMICLEKGRREAPGQKGFNARKNEFRRPSGGKKGQEIYMPIVRRRRREANAYMEKISPHLAFEKGWVSTESGRKTKTGRTRALHHVMLKGQKGRGGRDRK